MPDHLDLRLRTRVATVLATAFVCGCGLGEHMSDLPLPHAGASGGSVARGQSLLAQYQCGSCHVIPSVEASRGTDGPPLAAFGRRSYIAGHVPNGPDALAHWIVAPSSLVPGTTMPSMGVSQRDARDMAAFLLALE